MAHTRIIAHRGASGHLPEHTLPAKCLAYGAGADFLEQDLVASRDGILVVLHDLHLDDISDVAIRFPGRHRHDGRHYVIDFDLAELRELRLHERRTPGSTTLKFAGRFDSHLDGLRIVTFEEEMNLIASLNASMARNVGIYPEIKEPEWHLRHGIDLTPLVVQALRTHGYDRADANAFLQCFSAPELIRAATEFASRTPRVLLLDGRAVTAVQSQEGGWPAIRKMAQGVGLPFRSLLAEVRDTRPRPNELPGLIRRAGLQLHPYTIRADELGDLACPLTALLAVLIDELEVDGLFCDQPELAVSFRDRATGIADE